MAHWTRSWQPPWRWMWRARAAPKLRPKAPPASPGSGATVIRPVPGAGGAGGGTVDGFAKGSRVRHPSFGVGAVEELDGTGPALKLLVRFPPGVGLKKVLARFVERF